MDNLRVKLFERPFRKLTLRDKKWVEKICKEDGGIGSHIHFLIMFLVQEKYSFDSFRKINGCIIKRPWADQGKLYCQYPIGLPEHRKKAVEKIVKIYSGQYNEFVFFSASEDNLSELRDLFHNKITMVEDDRDDHEYFLDILEQLSLEGSAFADRRAKLRKFSKQYNWSYEQMTKENLEDCRAVNDSWYDTHEKTAGVDGEQKALKTMFSYFDQLDLQGGLLRVDGEPAAFCLGFPFNKDICVGLYIKGARKYKNATIIMVQEFLERNCAEYQYINVSADLGIPGLREFKLNLHPKFLLPSYSVTVKPFE